MDAISKVRMKVSVLLKLLVIVSAVIGTFLSAYAGRRSFMGGSPAGAFGFTSELPFMGCAWWILALLLFLLFVGFAYLMLANGIHRMASKKGKKA